MNVLRNFIDVFGTGVDVYVVYTLFSAVGGKRAVGEKLHFLSYVLFFIFVSTFSILNDSPFALLGVMWALTIGVSFCYRINHLVRLFSSSVLILLGVLAEIFAGLLISIVSKQSVEVLSSNTNYYILGVLISKAFYVIIIKIIQYRKLPKDSKLSISTVLPLLSLPASTLFIIYIMAEYAYSVSETESTIAISMASVLLMISNILVFYLFERQLRLDDQAIKSGLIQQQLRHQSEYFKEMAETYKVSNKTVHDTKNQLFAVSIALGNNEVDKAKAKIDELCRNVFGEVNTIKTGNDALDALLNTKYRDLDAQGIRLNHSIIISSTNSIDDIDLCIVVGNALDNAIEACLRDGEGGIIELTMKQTADYLAMDMSNPSKDKPLSSKGRLLTRKEDRALHGFGLQSIEEIAEKYEGHVSYGYENGMFALKVTLRNSM